MPYAKQMVLLRTVGNLKFAKVKFEILNISVHPEDGTVCMRWRIAGRPGLRVIYSFKVIELLVVC